LQLKIKHMGTCNNLWDIFEGPGPCLLKSEWWCSTFLAVWLVIPLSATNWTERIKVIMFSTNYLVTIWKWIMKTSSHIYIYKLEFPDKVISKALIGYGEWECDRRRALKIIKRSCICNYSMNDDPCNFIPANP